MALLQSDVPGLTARRGKVRDVYELGDDRLLIVASDRISAFDWVLPTPIPDKGRILTGLSVFWFKALGVPNHLISTDLDSAGLDLSRETRASLAGRSMIVRKVRIVPFECVARGYLSGSGWREYRKSGTVCGMRLPPGLAESAEIEPIFTPATKAESGHDENVSFATMARALGDNLAGLLRHESLRVYAEAAEMALDAGLILADTKFEWGFDVRDGRLLLADEVLTPDSSRFWEQSAYHPGGPQLSFDKQYVRDWLDGTGWDKQSTPPPLPDEVVARTRDKYVECFERLTGQRFHPEN